MHFKIQNRNKFTNKLSDYITFECDTEEEALGIFKNEVFKLSLGTYVEYFPFRCIYLCHYAWLSWWRIGRCEKIPDMSQRGGKPIGLEVRLTFRSQYIRNEWMKCEERLSGTESRHFEEGVFKSKFELKADRDDDDGVSVIYVRS